MYTTTDLKLEELKFMNEFKKLCTKANGNFDQINAAIKKGDLSSNLERQAKLEQVIQAQFIFSAKSEQH